MHTGAGISTSSGVPDFRGPDGLWTRRARGLSAPPASSPLSLARPTLSHMALYALVNSGHVHAVITANVDGLHRRSGLPEHQLAELHGSCFKERCEHCNVFFNRDFELETVGFARTGRWCSECCYGALVDQTLDWESEIPEHEIEKAERWSINCPLSLVLGSSLRIRPASELPVTAYAHGHSLTIVNLQKTPKDRKASLVAHSRCDYIMARVTGYLGLEIPEYIRCDRLALMYSAMHEASTSNLRLYVHAISSHGRECPIPWLHAVELQENYEQSSGAKHDQLWTNEQPDLLKSSILISDKCERAESAYRSVQVRLQLNENLSEESVLVTNEIDLDRCMREECIYMHTMVTDRCCYKSEDPSEDAIANAKHPANRDGRAKKTKAKRMRREDESDGLQPKSEAEVDSALHYRCEAFMLSF